MPTACPHYAASSRTPLRRAVMAARNLKSGSKWVELRICLTCGHVRLLRFVARPARTGPFPAEGRSSGHEAFRTQWRGVTSIKPIW